MKLAALGFEWSQGLNTVGQLLQQLRLLAAHVQAAFNVLLQCLQATHSGSNGLPAHILNAISQAGFRIGSRLCRRRERGIVVKQLDGLNQFDCGSVDEAAQLGYTQCLTEAIQYAYFGTDRL